MAIARVQGVGATETVAATTIAPVLSATTIGNLIVVVVGLRVSASGHTLSVSDGTANSYTQDVLQSAGSSANIGIYHSLTTASATTITATASVSSTMAAWAWEFSGVTTTADGTNSNAQNTGTAASSGGLTTTNAIDLVIAGLDWNGTGTISTLTGGFTSETLQTSNVSGSACSMQPGYQIVSATGTYTYGGTLVSVVNTGCIAAFKAKPLAIPRYLRQLQAVNRSAVI